MPFVRPARFYRFNQTQAAPPPPPPPVGGESLLTIMTVTELGSGAKTNELLEFGLPLSSNAMASGDTILVYDDNGAGAKGSLLPNFQIDNRVIDRQGDIRFQKVTGVIPSLGNSATRKLHVYRASADQALTGTPIATTDVQALSAYNNGLFKVTFDISGTPYSISVKDILDGGSASYNKTSYWIAADTWRSGPTVTEWRLRGAPRNGTEVQASGSGLHVEFHLAAYKAGPGAVSAGNPITGVRADATHENSDVTRGNSQHFYYGWKMERATALDDPTLTTAPYFDPHHGATKYTYDRSTPAATLTLPASAKSSISGTASDQQHSASRSSGTWDVGIVGAHIRSLVGSGKAVVRTSASATGVGLSVYENFGTSVYTAGQWAIEGVGHHYNTTFVARAWVGNHRSHVHWYGNNNSAVRTPGRAGLDYLAASEMIPPYAASASAYPTTDTTNLDNFTDAEGARRPLAVRGGQNNGYLVGDMTQAVGGAGERSEIGLIPEWQINALYSWGVNGRRRMFENVDHWLKSWAHHEPVRLSGSPSTGSLATVPRFDDTTINQGYTWTAAPVWNDGDIFWSNDTAHHHAGDYVPYLITGDFRYLRQLQSQAGKTDWISTGSQAVTHSSGRITAFSHTATSPNAFDAGQTRALAWTFRDRVLAASVVPASARDTLFVSRDHEHARMARSFEVAASVNGLANTRYTAASNGPTYFTPISFSGYRASYRLEGHWQYGYPCHVVGMAHIAGLHDANSSALADWAVRGYVGTQLQNGFPPKVLHRHYFYMLTNSLMGGSTDYGQTWSAMWQQGCFGGPDNDSGWGFKRLASSAGSTGKVIFSTTASGTGATATFGASAFAGGGTGSAAWYCSANIRIRNGDALSSTFARINSVNSNSSVGLFIYGVLATAEISADQITIPGPHPDDTQQDYSAWGTVYESNNCPRISDMAARMLAKCTSADVPSFMAWVTGQSDWADNLYPKYDISKT